MKAPLALIFLALAACTDSTPGTATREVKDTNVFDPVTRVPIERARGVEDTLRDSAADRRRQLEEAEGL
jgi:hypothetical protein